ncbi:MAG TPA: XrtA system polysaccharide deacetylase [Alphaproteobacteria bacterium]|nr:XrtA system polysaccharide deacetylase [Alphaproteobacteria bacterium]
MHAAPYARRDGRLVNALTVDVEDYFQVEAFAEAIPRDGWDSMPGRVERNTERLLDLFARHKVQGTFFTLGWVARRHPALVRRIVAEGHELASHGDEHVRADRQDTDAFRSDVRKTKALLEDLGGVGVRGYRAATFSIGAANWWAFDVLAEEGYAYSSSVYPIAHDLYGMRTAPRMPFLPSRTSLVEIPLTTVRLFGRNLPCAGGGYFRLLPYPASRWLMRRVNRRDKLPCVFYCHPWEIDPAQPRHRQAPLKSRLRHYLNLARMENRLERLLREFAWDRLDRVFLGDRGA